ncbi:SAM-dependent methyltransferase [Tumebacillus sp. DT12]|uniref:SAM-dependent methyltransferase n=1 Tax=Tumebacillus lacus TaxID=2995335 RepID=A0ABT3X3K2_9BACL|nr:SAM-dependent methyltransferase [Tumebacillus lacus]MCX7571469.1 SAM-dependent methyltransferase [Tumebacillus lacus]
MAMANQLTEWIRGQVLEQGPVPFVRFMEWALYHPEWGYYTRDSRKFGKEGDFYTSPGIHPVFAEMIADGIADKWRALGEPAAFTLIEFGAGEGKLARDVLGRLKGEHPALFAAVQYKIVEVSPVLRERQQATLAAYLQGGQASEVRTANESLTTDEQAADRGGQALDVQTANESLAGDQQVGHACKVVWVSEAELAAGAPYVGVVVTNELVDAYPVHRVRKADGVLQEVYVQWDASAERFVEVTGALTDPRIEAYLERYGKPLLNGQTAEVGLPGLNWYERALGLLRRGSVLTVDYGFEAEMLYHPSRMKGTLRGFYRHTLTDDPYRHIGEQDLTTDINFTALIRRGEELGWQTSFFGSQAKYLLDSGILNRLRDAMGADPFTDPDMKRNRAIRQLVTPGGIGDHFKVLVQDNLV